MDAAGVLSFIHLSLAAACGRKTELAAKGVDTSCNFYNLTTTTKQSHSELSDCMRCAQPCTFTGKWSHSNSKLSACTICEQSCTSVSGKHEVWATCFFTGKWSHSMLPACTTCGRYCIFTGKRSHSKLSACTTCGQSCTFTGKPSHSVLSAHTRCGQHCIFTGKRSHSMLSACTRCGQYCIFSLYTKTWPHLKLSACMK